MSESGSVIAVVLSQAAERVSLSRLAAPLLFATAFVCASFTPVHASASTRQRAAIVVTQAVGVGPLAAKLGNLTADRIAQGPLLAVEPGEAVRLLRQRQGPDPSSCGSDPACLEEMARILDAHWLISVGIGKLGEMYDLELRAVERGSGTAPRAVSATFAAPGPDWEQALSDALSRLLPAELLQPPATVGVTSNVAGAELLVDGRLQTTTPLETELLLTPGPHTLELRKAGYSTTRQILDAVAGEVYAVELHLAPVATSEPSSLRTWSYVAAGTSAAALIGAVVLHAGASSTMDDARNQKAAGRPFADTRSDALSRMDTSRILYGVAGAALVGAAALYLLEPPAPSGGAASP